MKRQKVRFYRVIQALSPQTHNLDQPIGIAEDVRRANRIERMAERAAKELPLFE